jgi:YegS/Rv2252/BmrU family lipid kinase
MTETTHVLFILNQTSRKGKVAHKRLKELLNESSFSHDIYLTQAPKHAKQLAQELGEQLKENQRLIVVGGDGTLNEVVSGLQEKNLNVPIGYIPAGSGNDFARSHNISTNINKALRRILAATTSTNLDILELHQDGKKQYAVNSTGAGIDGMVIKHVESKKSKEQIGGFSYFAAILSAVKKQQAFKVSVQTKEHTTQFEEALLVIGVNHKYIGGGINVHPQASPKDGLVNVVVVEKVSFLEVIRILFQIVTGARHLSHKKIHNFIDAHPCIQVFSNQFGQQDGELIEVSTTPWQFQLTKQFFWL